MISALHWVPKGASRQTPEKLKLTEEEVKWMHEAAQDEAETEYEMMNEQMQNEDSDESEDDADDSGLPAEFNMDNYDNEEDDIAIKNFINQQQDDIIEEGNTDEDGAEEEEDIDMEDDNDGLHEDELLDEDDELELDKDDLEIRQTDAVILVAHTEDDFSNLEIQVYDDDTGALYTHHEINLPAFPLCLAWMDCEPSPLDPTKGAIDGSFVAVGTFKPGIEIWNLDVLDVLEPSATLGGEIHEDMLDMSNTSKVHKRKGRKRTKDKVALRPSSHTDAVMALDWNSSHRNMLASGSADKTVKVWDITTQQCMYTMSHHSDKVQCVRWNPVETTVLASASFDKSAVVLDGRSPEAYSKFSLTADVECITWVPHMPHCLVVSTEDGLVVSFDVRMNGGSPLFTLNAHAGAVSAVSFSQQVPGLMATAGVDKTVKIWDVKDTNSTPICVTSKDMNVGELFALSFYRDSPFLLGVGGSKGILALWDTLENEGIERRFGSRVTPQGIEGTSTSTNGIAASFRSPLQIGEELAAEEEREAASKNKSNKTKSKKKKNK